MSDSGVVTGTVAGAHMMVGSTVGRHPMAAAILMAAMAVIIVILAVYIYHKRSGLQSGPILGMHGKGLQLSGGNAGYGGSMQSGRAAGSQQPSAAHGGEDAQFGPVPRGQVLVDQAQARQEQLDLALLNGRL